MTTTEEARALAAAEMVAAEWRAENNRLRTALAAAEADAAAARKRVRELEALIAAQVAADAKAARVVTVPSGVGKTYWPPRDGLRPADGDGGPDV